MKISWSFSTEKQANRLLQLLSILLELESDGNIWKFKRLAMYPSCDQKGLYFVVLLILVDKLGNPLYVCIRRNGNYRYTSTINWKEECE